jgi:hypothetical protein
VPVSAKETRLDGHNAGNLVASSMFQRGSPFHPICPARSLPPRHASFGTEIPEAAESNAQNNE